MLELTILFLVAGLVVLVSGALFVVWLAVKTLVWLLLLPLRLLFWLLVLPLLLLKFLLAAVLLIVLAPLLVVVLAAGLVAAGVAIVLPLLPFLLLGAVLYLLLRPADAAVVG